MNGVEEADGRLGHDDRIVTVSTLVPTLPAASVTLARVVCAPAPASVACAILANTNEQSVGAQERIGQPKPFGYIFQ
jgi:hypothetical protein